LQQRDDENSGRDLRVLGKHLFLVVGLAVKDAFRLSVVVQPVNKIQGDKESLCSKCLLVSFSHSINVSMNSQIHYY